MSKIVKLHVPCSCGSSNARSIYDNGSSFCWSCQQWFPYSEADNDLKGENIEPPEKPERKVYTKKVTLEEIKGLPIRGFEKRGIKKKVCEFFDVHVGYDEDGEIGTHYYPYEEGTYKVRKLPKEFTWIGKSDTLFGLDKFNGGGKRLIICEGEIDCLSVATAAYDKYGKIYPVCALSSSSMAKKSLLKEREKIRSFEQVILCFDEDDAGHKARDEAIKIIGIDKVRIVKLPENDANEVLMKHKGAVLQSCLWDAAPFIPAGILTTAELKAQMQALELEPSVPYPPCLEGVDSKLKGIRLGQIALYISGTGSGKSRICPTAWRLAA